MPLYCLLNRIYLKGVHPANTFATKQAANSGMHTARTKFFYDKTAPSVVRPPPKNRNNSA